MKKDEKRKKRERERKKYSIGYTYRLYISFIKVEIKIEKTKYTGCLWHPFILKWIKKMFSIKNVQIQCFKQMLYGGRQIIVKSIFEKNRFFEILWRS